MVGDEVNQRQQSASSRDVSDEQAGRCEEHVGENDKSFECGQEGIHLDLPNSPVEQRAADCRWWHWKPLEADWGAVSHQTLIVNKTPFRKSVVAFVFPSASYR